MGFKLRCTVLLTVVLFCFLQALRVQSQTTVQLTAEQKRYNQKLQSRYIVFFPEGFSLNLPLYTYFIEKDKNKYSFRFRDDSEKKTDLEIIITDFDLQKRLKDQHYYALGTSSKYMLYGYYEINPETGSPELRAYRLFSTIVTNEGKYITLRSPLFESMNIMNYYIQDMTSLQVSDRFDDKKYTYSRYNVDMSSLEQQKYNRLQSQIKDELDHPSPESRVVNNPKPAATPEKIQRQPHANTLKNNQQQVNNFSRSSVNNSIYEKRTPSSSATKPMAQNVKEETTKRKPSTNNKPSLKEMILSKSKGGNLNANTTEDISETRRKPASKTERKPIGKPEKAYTSKLTLKGNKYIEAVQPREPLRMATASKKLMTKTTSNKNRYIITFPEGFTLDLPLQTYLIEKKGDRYELCFRNDSKKHIELEVLVTNYNLQDYLKANNYFIVSKNRNFTLYGLFRNNFVTGKSEILGFRLFNTVAVNKNTYITVQSPLLESEDMKRYYINDVISLRRDDYSSRYSYEKYNSDMHKSVLSENTRKKQ